MWTHRDFSVRSCHVLSIQLDMPAKINNIIDPSPPAGHISLASLTLLTLVIGPWDQQMSKHTLIL